MKKKETSEKLKPATIPVLPRKRVKTTISVTQGKNTSDKPKSRQFLPPPFAYDDTVLWMCGAVPRE